MLESDRTFPNTAATMVENIEPYHALRSIEGLSNATTPDRAFNLTWRVSNWPAKTRLTGGGEEMPNEQCRRRIHNAKSVVYSKRKPIKPRQPDKRNISHLEYVRVRRNVY